MRVQDFKMQNQKNFAQLQQRRQQDARYNKTIENEFLVTPSFVQRLGLFHELEGHSGCVNCLEWSMDGKILASGSDDVQVIIWDPLRKKKLAQIATGHTGNIFTVKFLPNTGNNLVVTGAADQAVRIHDVIANELTRVCSCHTNRVKRCVTDPVSPDLFWSAGEDGMILQHDIREPHTCPAAETSTGRDVLINLCQFMGSKAEAKCLAVNPVKTEYIAVGANDPYVRIYDRRSIKTHKGMWHNDDSTVQYFVPGHLPSKHIEYKRKYRSLASTYLTFSPDGNELLVNLGGEQIYIFPTTKPYQTEVCNLVVPDHSGHSAQHHDVKEHVGTNGYSNGFKNGTTVHEIGFHGSAQLDLTRGMPLFRKSAKKVDLPPEAAELKDKANKAFEEKKYAKAIYYYNEGLKHYPFSPILYGNRSAALIKRGWDGDVYAALKDCQIALTLDPDHHKALLRMSRCLLELNRRAEAAACLKLFTSRFPDLAKKDVFKDLERDILKVCAGEMTDAKISSMLAALLKPTHTASSTRESVSSDSTSPSNPLSSEASFVTTDDDQESDAQAESRMDSPSSDSNSSSDVSFTRSRKRAEHHDSEVQLRDKAVDFTNRFCGHCNTTTDIKEANFFGGYIVAGSDDGSFFIWDRKTTNIVKVIKGDESIVNCLQPHPSTCVLATSGIESVIRLWAPMGEEEFVNDRVVDDVNNAASANQKRMNSNPFEVILMNMGYRMSGSGNDEDSDEDSSLNDVPVPASCNPS